MVYGLGAVDGKLGFQAQHFPFILCDAAPFGH